ncbi:MAG: bifunctional diaminohydroxyphosphoribosylaminopyrimidine deaminase/5-amino-6-(5-phosphoribosylamino)uracil reductase RibD [Fibrobacteraceae bacterium]|nr:bifunctional diaminohydroxyphosphoribosylaminopyrimidine deaminase/5-amino-6-(5-phosphoribosylamino)uracil reductase RibD [Fibrobacteraceae bacterium]
MNTFLQLAFDEAIRAIGISRPNPAVGAVVVRKNPSGKPVVIGMGHTQKPGEAHAEVMALKSAAAFDSQGAQGATIFVTLEPCCHYGRTPPCTKAIIDSGIKEVFYATPDANPAVRGKSKKILEDAGVAVYDTAEYAQEHNLASLAQLTAQIRDFYFAYNYFVCNKKTFVHLKLAESADGFIAGVNGTPVAITSENTNRINHGWRAKSDAILVSAQTLEKDNPSLTVRGVAGNNPIPFVLGNTRVLSPSLKIFNRIFCGEKNVWEHENFLPVVFSRVAQSALDGSVDGVVRAKVVMLPSEFFEENWKFVVDYASQLGMHRLFVEPGAALCDKILQTCLFDRFDLWTSSKMLGNGAPWNRNLLEHLKVCSCPMELCNEPPKGAVLDKLTVYEKVDI